MVCLVLTVVVIDEKLYVYAVHLPFGVVSHLWHVEVSGF